MAIKGPISLPDGEITPTMADTSRIQKEVCVAKVTLVKMDRMDPMMRVSLRPKRSVGNNTVMNLQSGAS